MMRKLPNERSSFDDILVVLPGLMGSCLADANGREFWAPTAGAIASAVRSLGKSVTRFTLPDGFGEDAAPDGVIATRLVQGLHILPGVWTWNIGYGRLIQSLLDRFIFTELTLGSRSTSNLVLFPYDWRLSVRATARQLSRHLWPIVEQWRKLPGKENAQVVFVAHSMGGLIARAFVELEGGHEVTRRLITLGTPHRGSPAALIALRNGVHKGLGPLRADLSMFCRRMPSMYELTPQYACVNEGGHRRPLRRSDYFDHTAMSAEESHLLADLEDARPRCTYDLHPIVGTGFLTPTTLALKGTQVELATTIDGSNRGGDGTVPLFAAHPSDIIEGSPLLHYVTGVHGGLPSHEPVLRYVEAVLSSRPEVYRDSEVVEGPIVQASSDELVYVGDSFVLSVHVASDSGVNQVVHIVIRDDARNVKLSEQYLTGDDGTVELAVPGVLPPGAYTVEVSLPGLPSPAPSPVHAFLVWDASMLSV